MLDAWNTSREIGENLPEIAVFGIGATEQHSIHLPVGTDWLGVSDLTRRVAAELDAFLVPALPFSMSECHGPMAGTVWLGPRTLAAVLRDTVHSLYAQGFRKVLIVNGFDRGTNDRYDYIRFYADPVNKRGYPFSYVLNESVIEGKISLAPYQTVIWILGDESTADQTFSSIEQDSVKHFLQRGGHLFVSGSEIGWDLDYKGSSSDQSFYHNYLKAQYAADAPDGKKATFYSCEAIPKGLLMKAMAEAATLRVEAPVTAGDTVCRSIAGSGVDLVACRTIDTKTG